MTLNDKEKPLIEHGHETIIVGLKIEQYLNDILGKDPIDSFDLNPHLQVRHVADRVVELLLQDDLTTTREHVLLLWLSANILGHRADKAIDGGAKLLEEMESKR